MRFWLEVDRWFIEIGASYGLCPFDINYFDISLRISLEGIYLESNRFYED
jgi:hypothetical protein